MAPVPSHLAPATRNWAEEAIACLGEGIVVVDTAARVLQANEAAKRYFGGTVPPDMKACPTVQRALAGESVRDHETDLGNPDVKLRGRTVVSSVTPLRDEHGRVYGAVCLLRESGDAFERQTKAILDNIPDMAWVKDRQGRFTGGNVRLAEAAGKSNVEELLGLLDSDLWPTELAARYRADDEEVMRTGLHKRIEEPFVDVNGRTYWIETVKMRIAGENGEVLGTTGIARDITERKRAEQALRMTNEELERRVAERTFELGQAQENLVRKERLAVLGQLAGGVAHQIRNPLAAIMNASYVLKRRLAGGEHPDVEDAIRIIHDEVRHANVIITGLLDYARVRAPDRHPTSIVELVERVLASDWIPSSVRIERSIDEVPLVDVDANQLHGAFFNIVRNAVEAMPNGGVLGVEVRRREGEIVVSVTDTGPGLSPQVRAHLFEPLHSTKPMGIGLGLVTARTFIEAHGGSITSIDRPRGACFEVRLPTP